MVNEFDMAAAIKSLMTGEARSAPMDAAFITDEFVFLDDARLGAADGPSTAGITEHEASNGVTGDANTTGASFETDISDLSVPKGALQNGANLEDGDRDLQVAARDGDAGGTLHRTASTVDIASAGDSGWAHDILTSSITFAPTSFFAPHESSSAFVFAPFDGIGSVAAGLIASIAPHPPQPPSGETTVAGIPISATPEQFESDSSTVLVNGDGEVVSALSNSTSGPGGATTGGTSGGTPATSTGAATASPFVINVTWDASVGNAPAGFKTAVMSVVQYFESQFTDHVTINIAVGYGEVGGYTLGSGALGESLTYLSNFTYAQVRNALAADAKTADDAAAIASLPSTSPVNGTFWESTAEAKATGLLAASGALDGYVGFAAGNLFDFDNSNGVSAGLYDFFGTVAHEISEVMGRSLLVGGTIGGIANGYYPLDLFHYMSSGARDFVGTTAGYFSINSGATDLDNFNTNSGGDFGDWASSAGNDAFRAFSPSGVTNVVSNVDLQELDVIGWDRGSSGTTPSPTPVPPPAKPDLVVTGLSFTGSHFSYHVGDAGAGAAAASTAGIYVSSSATGPTTLIGTIATGALAAGASDTESGAISWATNTAPGTYYVSVAADYKNVVAESNESNNQSGKIAIVLGNGSSNTLTGTPGNDVIIGLGGHDTLTGGAGADQFVFNTALNSTNVATVMDFSHLEGDRLDLDHTLFAKLTSVAFGAALSANDFYASANGAAHNSTDRIVYNTTTGALYYDADGTGATAAVQFATLAHHPVLTASDFLVV